MRHFTPAALIVLALTGCAVPPTAREVRPPVVVAPPPRPTPVPPPLASDWNDWPFTPGDWTYRRSDVGALAMFGTAQVMLRCDLARRTIMLRVNGGTGTVMVRTTTISRSIAVDADGVATLSATDPLLDAMAFSRGRFVMARVGAAPLVVPPYAEIGRVIEDCRE